MDTDIILERIACGDTLRAIAADIGWHEATIRKALRATPELSARYDAAQIDRAHLLADQILELADNATLDDIARVRLQVDTRKWLCAKLYPRMYGDRVQTELSGAVGISHEAAVRALLAEAQSP